MEITLEEMAYLEGRQVIAGVDEAGRGPLAGPVVAAACVLPRKLAVEGIDDSKKLSSKKRELIYHQLTLHSEVSFGIGIVEHAKIDEINILQASLEAMAIAVKRLPVVPDFLLIDGNCPLSIDIASKTVIKGDSLSQSIGAASIIAKYTRDQIMLEFHLKWPQYGFDRHKGYPTQMHMRAIRKYGPCPIHRQSFGIVKSMLMPISS